MRKITCIFVLLLLLKAFLFSEVIIMNNNQRFTEIDIVSFLDKTNKKCLFFDGWSLFDPKEITKVTDIVYHGLGFKIE